MTIRQGLGLATLLIFLIPTLVLAALSFWLSLQ